MLGWFLVEPEDEEVAVFAAKAAPVARPPVNAPIARALRTGSFILCPFSLMLPLVREHDQCAAWTCGCVQKRVTTR